MKNIFLHTLDQLEHTGINRRTLYKVFDQKGNPSFGLVSQVMQGLGLQIVVKPKSTKKERQLKRSRRYLFL